MAGDAYLERAHDTAKSDGIPAGVSVYEWAEANLRLHSPAAAAEVDRTQAESKFFRTLTAVAIVAAAAGFLSGEGTQLVVSLLLLPVAVRRFFDLRLKATQLAYRYYVIIRAQGQERSAGEVEREVGS
jgi:hypothetical protein